MRIAQVAPLYESVPPRLYGGTERVVSYLTEALVSQGHEVTLFASGDSVTNGKLEAHCAEALRLDPHCQDSLAPHLAMLGQVYRRAAEFDVIHCHTNYLGLPLTSFARTPTVLTLHGRLDIPEIAPLYADYPNVALVSISDHQRRPLPNASWSATIYHGLPLDLYVFQPQPRSSLLFLGRISPEKRPDIAIQVACRAGVVGSYAPRRMPSSVSEDSPPAWLSGYCPIRYGMTSRWLRQREPTAYRQKACWHRPSTACHR